MARCKHEWVPIVYGLPGAELFAKAERGEVELGGCMISPGNPSHRCSKCGKCKRRIR